ncbi:MAG TPA: menaquinone biosynthesis protein [Candidatus Sulfotelmatobacter sp.]|nr:menaquinone biosynthesis protein [Candidatus Sulfotelmatobacter sp.]
MLKLGRVRYINCEPVYYALEHGVVAADCQISDGTPAELNERLRGGELDVSVVSAMEAALRPERYRLLPDLAIAADGPVESVLLVSARPVKELNGQPVALSRHSLTSVYLVQLLLEQAEGLQPRFLAEADAASAVARLLIGDEALREGRRWPHRLDLGGAWRDFTGLPFVFAVWAVRHEVWEAEPEAVRALHAALLRAKVFTREHPDAMVALAQTRTGLPAEACRQYLRERLSFDLGPRHLAGLRRFLEMLAKSGQLPAVPPLAFISV